MKKFAVSVMVLLLMCSLLAVGYFAAQAQDSDYRTLVPVGSLQMYAGDPAFAPTGWLVADGSCVSTVVYAELYAVVGDTFDVCAGPPEEDPLFALPDMRGRVPVGAGAGTALTARTLGDLFGEEMHTLTLTEIPSHTHGVTDPGHTHTIPRSGGATSNNPQLAAGSVAGAVTTSNNTTGISIQSAGGGQPHNIMQPSLVLNYLIWSGLEPFEVPAADIDITVVVVFPSHTPTPTLTPSLTPTPGPSPTNTPTATPTYSPEVIYSVGGQDVKLAYTVTPGDAITVALLVVIIVLLMTGIVFYLRRR